MKEKTLQKKTGLKDALVGSIVITHPEREVFPDAHITKADLARYYEAAASLIMERIARRPVSLVRCPSGLSGECFFQRNPDAHMRKHVKSFAWKHNGKKHEYLYIENEEDLIFLIQMGVVEIHPWGATVDAIDYPGSMIFDLDPDEGIPFEAVRLAAREVGEHLRAIGLESCVKCTGGKGLHVTVPLAGKDQWPEVRDFARRFAESLAGEAPDAYAATMAKAKRKGKIFIDYFRNDYTATAVADYSVRARPGAPVAVPVSWPVSWKELENLGSANAFTMADVLERIRRRRALPPPCQAQKLPGGVFR